MTTLTPNKDYYLNEQGNMVLTEAFLASRGYCCQSGCKHCPYGYSEKVDPEIPVELQNPWEQKEQEIEIYEGEIEEL